MPEALTLPSVLQSILATVGLGRLAIPLTLFVFLATTAFSLTSEAQWTTFCFLG